jgi:hypothetical protein
VKVKGGKRGRNGRVLGEGVRDGGDKVRGKS